MRTTKREEVRGFVQAKAVTAIYEHVGQMNNREHAEAIRQNCRSIATVVSWAIQEEYGFLQLADIMEWKRTRVRR